MRIQTLFALALLYFSPIAAHAQEAVTLRYKFMPGQTRHYKMTMTMNTTILTGQSGAGLPMNMTMTTTLNQTVKSVRPSDGAATVVAQLEDMQMTMNGKETSLPAAQQAPMRKPFTSVMLPTGKVLSMQIPSMPSAGMAGMDFSKGLFNSTVSFPVAPVKVGDTWPGSAASGMVGMKMLMASTLTSLETKDGSQDATISQKLSGLFNMTLSKKMPMTMKMAGRLTGFGTQVFDMTLGAIRSQSMTASTEMTMTVHSKSGQAALPGMPKVMKMKMQQKTQMDLVDDAAPTSP